MKKLLLITILLLITSISEAKELVLNVHPIRPDVMKDGDGYIGFGIDIANEIAQINDYQYTIVESATFGGLLDNIKNDKVDLAIAGISLTSTRERDMDFSYGYLDNGFGIMVQGREKTILENWIDIFLKLKWVFLIIGICAILLFISELSNADSIRNDVKGIGDSLWCLWAVLTTVGFGDITPKTWKGKVLVVIISFILIGAVFPTMVDVFTNDSEQSLITDVHNLKDLQNKKVATVQHTTSQDELVKIIPPENLTLTPNIETAYKLLREGTVNAVVFDHSVLKYDFNENNMDEFELVLLPEIFKPTPYAIAIPKENSEIYEEIKVALRKIQENGVYDRIHFKWFGE